MREVIQIALANTRIQCDVICDGCWTDAKNISDFKMKCVKVEEALGKYCRENNVMQLSNQQLRSISKQLISDETSIVVDLTEEDNGNAELVCIDLVSKSSSCSTHSLADEDDDIFDEMEIRKNEAHETTLLIPDVGIRDSSTWSGSDDRMDEVLNGDAPDTGQHISTLHNATENESNLVKNLSSRVPSEDASAKLNDSSETRNKEPNEKSRRPILNATCRTYMPKPMTHKSVPHFGCADYGSPLDLSVGQKNKEWAEHVRSGNKLWCCHVCHAWYADKYSLLQHLRMHSGQQFFENWFGYSAAPQNSIWCSGPNRFFVCPYCCNVYPQKPILMNHIFGSHMWWDRINRI